MTFSLALSGRDSHILKFIPEFQATELINEAAVEVKDPAATNPDARISAE